MPRKRRKPKDISKRLQAKRSPEIQAILDKVAANRKQRKIESTKIWIKSYADGLKTEVAPEKTLEATNCFVNSPLTSKWKKLYWDETLEKREMAAIAEAESKFKSVAPSYNKGPLQPICKTDLHTIGKKV